MSKWHSSLARKTILIVFIKQKLCKKLAGCSKPITIFSHFNYHQKNILKCLQQFVNYYLNFSHHHIFSTHDPTKQINCLTPKTLILSLSPCPLTPDIITQSYTNNIYCLRYISLITITIKVYYNSTMMWYREKLPMVPI